MPSGISKTVNGWNIGPEITGVTINSQAVQPGYAFIAIPGQHFDGHYFIDQAVQAGAAAIVGEKQLDHPLAVPYIRVESSRKAAAEISAAFYHHPSQQLRTVAVTGTNGKTSVVYWLRHFLANAQWRTGLVSSIKNDTLLRSYPTHLTTPESPDLQNYLAEMRDHHASHAVVEVSSHGIVQHRVDCTHFVLAILTNITREHLDFHGTMERYVAAKSRLFEQLSPNSLGAVLNADDANFSVVRSHITAPILTYGLHKGMVRAHILHQDSWFFDLEIEHPEFTLRVRLNKPGVYNVYNLLAAVTAAYALGVPTRVLAREIPLLPEVPGRMQVFPQPLAPLTIVDYAHTPDGLMQALKTVRNFVPGRVWAVFGGRGCRDHGKRPEMGKIAAMLADKIILTTDSPYHEDAEEIAHQIQIGIDAQDPSRLERIELDRARAIQYAVSHAASDDVVLVTGRGPERMQYLDDHNVAVLDADLVQKALKSLSHREESDVSGAS
ncbi:MAG: UDP-N-acetylmuramoyl-L-alanyl-D-glutamate--2,6-diaminopimelate ligase [Firmicutes bacterium]|nr:UDP-N-acetylmuramoyl-L-alanyl-D-glutamate--2,6-diaminopimelate ligase [Bacillota bacterium]